MAGTSRAPCPGRTGRSGHTARADHAGNGSAAVVAVPSEVQSLKNGWVAEPLHGADRGRFLERVAELLAGVEIGDGSVARAARLAVRALAGTRSRAPRSIAESYATNGRNDEPLRRARSGVRHSSACGPIP